MGKRSLFWKFCSEATPKKANNYMDRSVPGIILSQDPGTGCGLQYWTLLLHFWCIIGIPFLISFFVCCTTVLFRLSKTRNLWQCELSSLAPSSILKWEVKDESLNKDEYDKKRFICTDETTRWFLYLRQLFRPKFCTIPTTIGIDELMRPKE